MTRAELVALVRRIQTDDFADEAEADAALDAFAAAVPHPEASGLIFWPADHFDHEPTAEEVVDAALAHRPIEL